MRIPSLVRISLSILAALPCLVSAAPSKPQEVSIPGVPDGRPVRAETWWYKAGQPNKVTFSKGQFMLDGKPIVFLCGEMHPVRIPREYWKDRIHKAKAMGLNAVSIYVFWSSHEREKGKFDFTGNRDIAEFIRLCGEEGLFVFLRPGPYVCAEYDFGGLPWWLLEQRDMKIRSRDPKFLAMMDAYIGALGKHLGHLQVTRKGPIFMVQVENEYGSYDKDKEYLAAIRDMYRKAGFDVNLNTCDGGGQMPRGSVEGCLPTANGVQGMEIFNVINRNHPGGPYMVSEFYPAWFDVWGQPHSRRDANGAANTFSWMIERGISVSIYMFHGGTNFEFTNGANQMSKDQPYAPQPTSYDYDAPLGESGNITPKYRALRAAIEKVLPAGVVLPPVPVDNPVSVVPRFETTKSVSLAALLRDGAPWARAARKSDRPMTFEALGQDFGYVLYRTKVPRASAGTLRVEELRDYAVAMVDGRPVGTMDRRLRQDSLQVDIPAGATLDLLVENVGRLNYGPMILDNHKGITAKVTLDGQELKGWTQYPLPLHRAGADIARLRFGAPVAGVPAFHKGTFNLDKRGDVFLDLGSWGKGAVWVNGHSIGKFWRIGPQQTLYVPAPWLRQGVNEVVVLEILDQNSRSLAGLEEAVLDTVRSDATLRMRPGKDPVLDEGDKAWAGTLKETSPGRCVVRFDRPVTARHVCIEFEASASGEDFVCIPEISPVDPSGRLMRMPKALVWWASSEETDGEMAVAENVLDGKAGTWWHSRWKGSAEAPPHRIVIDLGGIVELGGVQFSVRKQEQGKPGKATIYARPQFFL